MLALQGAFAAHRASLERLGVEVVEVRRPEHVDGLDAVVLPGGESTTMARLLVTSGLRAPLGDLLTAGTPVLGTCAGTILLASTILDGRPDQWGFGCLDAVVRRNGYGRQVDSFETDLDVAGMEGGPFHAVFIRAPIIVEVGDDVEVLAAVDGRPVVARQGAVTATTFHPELTGDDRLHRLFLQAVTG